MLNASESIEDCTYIVHLQQVIMNSHNNLSPVGLVAQLYIDLHLSRVTMNSHNDPPPVDLIGQLVGWSTVLNASESIEDCTYIVHLQQVIMNSHNDHSPVGLVAQLVEHCIDFIGIAAVRV